jgi:DNA-binding LacI/PurR family transcriptional regulator
MRAAGLGRLASIIPGGLTEAEGSRAASWLIDGPDPDSATAAFVFNDQSAVGFLATLRASGINVPRQMSVVSYDDSRLARATWARLTTIGQHSGRSPKRRWSEQSRESPASCPANRC